MLNRTTKASLLTSGEQSNALLPKVAPAQARDRGLHVLEMPLQGTIPLGAAPVAEGLTADPQPVADLRRRDPGPLARAAESCQASSSLRSCKPQAAVGFANRVVVVGMERRHLSWQKGRLDSKGTRPNVLQFSVRW